MDVLGKFTVILGAPGGTVNFIPLFDKKIKSNNIDPDGTPLSAASHQGLCCLRMSHKKDTLLKCFMTNVVSQELVALSLIRQMYRLITSVRITF